LFDAVLGPHPSIQIDVVLVFSACKTTPGSDLADLMPSGHLKGAQMYPIEIN
jgi:hypothetical protein